MAPHSDDSLPSAGAAFKYRQLAEFLQERIRHLPHGSRLPSVRSLVARHRVSLQTVKAAIAWLDRQGGIERRGGSGIYVRHGAQVRHIVLHRMNFPSASADVKQGSVVAACHKEGWVTSIRSHDVDSVHPLPEPHGDPDGIVVMADAFARNPEGFLALAGGKTSLTLLGRDSLAEGVDFVTGDDDAGLSMMLKELARRGHRRIGFVVNEPRVFEVEERIKSFLRLSGSLDIAHAEAIDCGVVPGRSGIAATAAAMAARIGREKGRFSLTALLTCSGSIAPVVLRALHEHHIRVPRDCSVFGMGEEIDTPYLIPSVSSVSWGAAEWGSFCVSIFKRRFQEEKRSPRCLFERVPPRLHWRESVGDAPSARSRRTPAGKPRKRP